MALRIMRSFRIIATRATFLVGHVGKLVVEGPKRGTSPDRVRAAMYSTPRTDVRPPAMALRPRIRPESRLIGATPTRAAT